MPERYVTYLSNLLRENNVEVFAEIGVLKGEFARVMLSSVPSIKRYFAIDPWRRYGGVGVGRSLSHRRQNWWDACHLIVSRLCIEFPQVQIVRAPSLEAVTVFADGFFDAVFIDADHSEEAAAADMRAWTPKVKIGGLVIGHDYSEKFGSGVPKAFELVFGKKPETVKFAVWVERRVA